MTAAAHDQAEFRARLWRILESPHEGPGRWVAAFLIILIFLNSIAVIIGSVQEVQRAYGDALWAFEALSVLIFTAEYAARLWASAEDGPRWRYALTPGALIDLAAILPFYLGALIGADLRILRLLRLLRLLKLSRYFAPLQVLGDVIQSEARSILAAMGVMIALITISAALMHYAERAAQPEAFGDIPKAMWWSAVTLTTVGYGDVAPVTPIGRLIAVVVMALGVGMVALPAGMLASRFSEELTARRRTFAAALPEIGDNAEKIEGLREDLCLSPEDARRAREEGRRCPHCGRALDEPVAPPEALAPGALAPAAPPADGA